MKPQTPYDHRYKGYFGLLHEERFGRYWDWYPSAVAAAWIPLRSDLPNTDVALLLVLCVGAVAMVGGRGRRWSERWRAATAFDLFDTPPYGQLYMTRGRDVVTTLRAGRRRPPGG